MTVTPTSNPKAVYGPITWKALKVHHWVDPSSGRPRSGGGGLEVWIPKQGKGWVKGLKVVPHVHEVCCLTIPCYKVVAQ